MSSRFIGQYIEWRKSRLSGLDKYLKLHFLENKKLLELGCGTADIGYMLSHTGAIVTGCDARKEHLDIANSRYPYIKTFIYDGDKEAIQDKYEIILHWGLLYHLDSTNLVSHLQNVMNCCDYLFLETEVCDFDGNEILVTEEEGFDQAYNKNGSRPTEKYVEKIIKDNGFDYKLIKDKILNSSFHTYDWEITNTKTWRHGLRRYWICWNKNKECPIKQELLT
jgi:predicted TPR repeat methyltransferase